MKLFKRHLHIYDLYEGKKTSLESIGTKEEKELFQNGEFEKITQLITTEYKVDQKQLTDTEILNHQLQLNHLFDNNWNKKSIKYLSRKYCAPAKDLSAFDKFMMMLWAILG